MADTIGTEQILSRILSNTFTATDYHMRLLALEDKLNRRLYGGEAPAATSAYDADAVQAVEAWGDDVLDAISSGRAHERIEELRTRAASLPELILYVPVPFTSADTAALGTWCREEVRPDVLLNVRVDPASVGGCIIAWQGKLYDFSFDYFLAKAHGAFENVVASYARAAPAAV